MAEHPANKIPAFEDIQEGMSASLVKTITEDDITAFARLTGDTNPVHLDEDFAGQSFFKGRIAHGMLTASLISAVLGTKLPGPGCVYLSQNLKFLAPVKIGETVEAKATVAEIITAKRRVIMKTECYVGDKMVIAGEALLWMPDRKK